MLLENTMSSAPFDLNNIIVRAGAGAGKTTELTQRVLGIAESFYQKNQRFPKLVVTTFTRKATQELRERLMTLALQKMAENQEKREGPSLVDFVKRPHLLQISTIHGILSRFIQQSGIEIGLSPDFQFISSSDDYRKLKRILRRLSQQNSDFATALEEVLESVGLNDFLQMFIGFSEAKSTKNLIGPISENFFREQVQKEWDLLISLRNKLVEIINVHKDLSESWQTYRDIIQRIHPQMSLEEIIEELPSVRKSKTTSPELLEAREQFSDLIKKMNSFNRTDVFFYKHQVFSKNFELCSEILFEKYQEEKIHSSELTMSDLETLALKIIKSNPERAREFSEGWDYWMVDEYQDTSPVQVALLEKLRGNRSEYVVGDPQQSIYLFRGARSEVFELKEFEIKANLGFQFNKIVNYRSRSSLLEFFNDVFFQKSQLGSQQFRSMEPKDQDYDLENPVATFYWIPDKKDESGEVSSEHLALLESCRELIFEKKISPEKICILFRSNQGIDDFLDIANRFGLPVQVHSSGQFAFRPEVIELNCLLRFLVNPSDNINLISLLRTPYFKIDDLTLIEWCLDRPQDYWKFFKNKDHIHIKTLKASLESAEENGIGEAFWDLIIKGCFFEWAHLKDPSGFREANIWKYVHQMRQAERTPGFSYRQFLKKNSSMILSTEDSGDSVAVPVVAPSKVNLMTVHASKGLQFNHVIVPGAGKVSRGERGAAWMVQESINIEEPSYWTVSVPNDNTGSFEKSVFGEMILREQADRAKLEEERVFYVALTRAIDSVTLISNENPQDGSWMFGLNFEKIEDLYFKPKYKYRVRRTIPNINKNDFISETNDQICVEKLPWSGRAGGPLNSLAEFHETAERASVTSLITAENRASLESSKSQESGVLDNKNQSHQKSQLPRKLKMSDMKKVAEGTKVHRILECLKYFWMNHPEGNWQEVLPEIDSDYHEALEYVCESDQGLWPRLIISGEVEYGFTVRISNEFNQTLQKIQDENLNPLLLELNEKLIQGQIDLWGQDKDGKYWIVDYKTGSTFFLEKAFRQLSIYEICLKAMGKIPSHEAVHRAVIYPFDKKTFIR